MDVYEDSKNFKFSKHYKLIVSLFEKSLHFLNFKKSSKFSNMKIIGYQSNFEKFA